MEVGVTLFVMVIIVGHCFRDFLVYGQVYVLAVFYDCVS